MRKWTGHGLWTAARRWMGQRLSDYLSQAVHVHGTSAPTDPVKLMACIRPGDVVLVEGHSRIAWAIKYLTQSTWSHAALYACGRQRGGSTAMKQGALAVHRWRRRVNDAERAAA